jgi:hypothetical protein
VNEIRKCPDCGGAIAVIGDPEEGHTHECSICFAAFIECGAVIRGTREICLNLIPPNDPACVDCFQA